MRILCMAFVLIWASSSALAQGTLDGLALSTGINGGVVDPTEKAITAGDALTMRIQDFGANVSGQILLLALDRMDYGLPLGIPCFDLDGNPGTCEANITGTAFFLLNLASQQTMPASGYQITINTPEDPSFWAAPTLDTLRVQAATSNPASPLGVSVTGFVDHFVGNLPFPGPTGDDSFTMVPFEGSVSFYGVSYTEAYVSSNGYVSFGAGSSEFQVSEASFLAGEPRIAPLWTDLVPGQGGTITSVVTRQPLGVFEGLSVHYEGVDAFGGAIEQNTVTVDLLADGSIQMDWSEVAVAAPALVGITPGGGLSPVSLADLTGSAPLLGLADEALYTVFGGSGCGDEATPLQGSIGLFTPNANGGYDYASSRLELALRGLSPSYGPIAGGTLVTIDGAGFDASETYEVSFGGGAPVPAIVVDPCTLQVTAPAASTPGPRAVSVTEVGGVSGIVPTDFGYFLPGFSNGTLPLGDDASALVSLTNGRFSFYGTVYDDFYVNANGNVTFGAPDSEFSETISGMANGTPRIALFWTDLAPHLGGSISFIESPLTMTIAFDSVPAMGVGGTNTGAIILDKAATTRTVTLVMSECSAFNGTDGTDSLIVGISGGAGPITPITTGVAGSTLAGGADHALFEELNNGGAAWNLDFANMIFIPTNAAAGGPYLFQR